MSSNPHLDRRLTDFERRLELLATELQELRWLVAGLAGPEKQGAAPAKNERRISGASYVTYSWQEKR